MRRFRVELFEEGRGNRSLATAPNSSHVDHILRELTELRTKVASSAEPSPAAAQSVDKAIAVWSGVEDIQQRLEVTRSEVSALKAKGIGATLDGETSRTTDELRAVITGTEEATDAILAAAEAIDDIAQRMCDSDEEAANSDGQVIAASVLQIFEACNFQDISGQRITKVVESLQFIEERIASMIDVWQALTSSDDAASAPAEPQPPETRLLNGPALKTDPNVVTQDDVDAMFR